MIAHATTLDVVLLVAGLVCLAVIGIAAAVLNEVKK